MSHTLVLVHYQAWSTIEHVLYIPQFRYNLLSVSKITKALQCFVAFFPDLCIFQDLYTKMVKAISKEIRGLYLLAPHLTKTHEERSMNIKDSEGKNLKSVANKKEVDVDFVE